MPIRCGISSPRVSAATAGTARSWRREDGEEPVGRTFIKQRCRKAVDGGRTFDLTTHYFRKRGQRQFDARTDRETEGQFESLVRFEWTLGP